ncbi:MAG: hypothetical protein ABIJ95_07035 [Pseudomonadota bacterium]
MKIPKIPNIPRKLSVLVVTGIPAIVGGGVVYALSGESYTMVVLWEVLLAAGMLTLALNTGNTEDSHH